MKKIFLLTCVILQTFSWSYGSAKTSLTIKNPMHLNPKKIVAITGVRLIENNGVQKIISEDLLDATNEDMLKHDYLWIEKKLRDGSWSLYSVHEEKAYLDSHYDNDTRTLKHPKFPPSTTEQK